MLWHVLWHGLLGSLTKIRSHKGVFVLTPHLHIFFIAISPFIQSSSSSDTEIFMKYLQTLIDKTPALRAQHCVFIGIFIFIQPNWSRNRKMPLGDWNDIENLHKSVLTGVQILNSKDLWLKRSKVVFIHRRLVVTWNRELQHSLWSMTFKMFCC